jgi:hypothetical protein
VDYGALTRELGRAKPNNLGPIVHVEGHAFLSTPFCIVHALLLDFTFVAASHKELRNILSCGLVSSGKYLKHLSEICEISVS